MHSLSSTRTAGSSSARASSVSPSFSRSTSAARPALARASAGEARQILRPYAATPNPIGGNCRRRRLGLVRSTSPPSVERGGSRGASLACVVRAGLKLTESFDASLPLDDEKREALFARLSDPGFCAQVSLETTRATKAVEFTGKVFTPVPWSPATPKGMPAEYEEFAEDAENYVVINVPPTLPFKANVLGKRVCAIYKIVGDAE